MGSKIKDVIKFFVGYLWSLFLKKKDIWIITERRNECKDNGYHLFRFIRTNYPTINVYYAIDRESQQRKKIEFLQNILDFNSIRHYAYALAASKLIGAFLPCGIPDSMCFYKYGDNILKGQICFLQHGITKEKIESLMSKNTKADLFVCGAKPEYEYIKNEFGYTIDQVKYTGFARFDALFCEPSSPRFILLMPTWRQYLSSQTWGERNEDFIESMYFKTYQRLLNNSQLIKLLETSDIELIFYPHHEIQGDIQLFSTINERISIASERMYDVQKLLKDASLLITDYSSVAFDFAYMNKPLLYYQFDENEYYDKHYKRGYFSYDEMGFGVVCRKEEELILQIEKSIKGGFKNDKVYKDRIDKFFALRDQENCKRIFDEICKL